MRAGRVPQEAGSSGWLAGGRADRRGGLAEARGPAAGTAFPRGIRARLGAVLASADRSKEGTRMPAAGLCVSVECVFLGSLCALPLAVVLGVNFTENLPSKALGSFAFYWML